jgi:hypothetical protein
MQKRIICQKPTGRVELKQLMSILLLTALWTIPARAQVTNQLEIDSFETPADLSLFTCNGTSVTLTTNGATDGQYAALVVFSNVSWPNIYFQVGTGFTNGDWHTWGGLAVDVLNTNAQSVTVDIRVDDSFLADGINYCRTGTISVPAGQEVTVGMPFTNLVPPGMMGGPPLVFGAYTMSEYGSSINLSNIVAFQIFLPLPGQTIPLFIDNIRLVPLPNLTGIADAYGQYTGGNWTGKVLQDADFQTQNTNEIQWLATNRAPADREVYGGWQNGPQLTATGFFRTACLTNGLGTYPVSGATNQGRWWLVTPSGRLFFSLGVDVIDFGETTTVAGRESLFAWLPATNDPLAQFSEPGANRTANFYGMNLWRKYGTNWNNLAGARVFARLASWGFNTIGNWSSSELFGSNRVAFTVPVWYDISTLAQFSSAGQTMPDVFDTNFPGVLAYWISNTVNGWTNNSWCLGYFIDNELPWAGWTTNLTDQYALPIGVLAASNSLPAKAEFSRLLQTRYASIAALNAAWGTSLASWAGISNGSVTLPSPPSAACISDLSAFLSDFAQRYFSLVNTNLKQYAPAQLYLGCRFASHPMEAVLAAAQYCDVISFNIYALSLDTNAWAFVPALNKPCLIGEFHFGALDSGMFAPGLVQAANQAGRGQDYEGYVRSVLSLPGFVGCHWFQYYDEPLTGRFDGENYNIGMVSGTDTPYWDLISAAQQINSQIYVPFAPATLAASLQSNVVSFSWPFLPDGFILESTPALSPANNWQTVSNLPVFSGASKELQLPLTSNNAFFRLRLP